jgi:hypothetical protein
LNPLRQNTACAVERNRSGSPPLIGSVNSPNALAISAISATNQKRRGLNGPQDETTKKTIKGE